MRLDLAAHQCSRDIRIFRDFPDTVFGKRESIRKNRRNLILPMQILPRQILLRLISEQTYKKESADRDRNNRRGNKIQLQLPLIRFLNVAANFHAFSCRMYERNFSSMSRPSLLAPDTSNGRMRSVPVSCCESPFVPRIVSFTSVRTERRKRLVSTYF